MWLRLLTYSFVLVVLAGLAPAAAAAQALGLPSDANPLLDPGSDKRRIEDDRRVAEFQRIDTNGDGSVSFRELADRRTTLFRLMDRNGDGALSLAEFRIRRLDLPKDAKPAVFARLDADKNGAIDLGEYQAADETDSRSADIDGDGQLTIWEYRTRD